MYATLFSFIELRLHIKIKWCVRFYCQTEKREREKYEFVILRSFVRSFVCFNFLHIHSKFILNVSIWSLYYYDCYSFIHREVFLSFFRSIHISFVFGRKRFVFSFVLAGIIKIWWYHPNKFKQDNVYWLHTIFYDKVNVYYACEWVRKWVCECVC